MDRRAWFDELVVWHIWADLNVPGLLLDKQAAALLLDMQDAAPELEA